MIGRVISTKLKQTATVLVERMAMHALYKKTFLRTKKYLVDDSIGVNMGDVVEIVKCKPISKNKHWKIVKVIGKNLAEIIEAQQKKAAEEIIAKVMPEEEESDKGKVKSEKSEEKTKNLIKKVKKGEKE